MMDVFARPRADATFADIEAHFRRCREYLLQAADPNETAADGRTLITTAITLSASDEAPLRSLLDRGADPNRPTAYTNFACLLTASNSLPLVELMLERGLRVNDVVEIAPSPSAMTSGPTTLLDYALAVQRYISPKSAEPNQVVRKRAGSLRSRQGFIAGTISLLRSRGAKTASEILGDCDSSSEPANSR